MTTHAPADRFKADCGEIVGLIRRRRFTEGRRKASQVYKEAEAEAHKGYMGRALMYQIECRVKQGDFVDIEPLTREAVSLMITSEFPASALRVLRIYANALLMQGRVDAALEAVEEAIGLEERIAIRTGEDSKILRRAKLEDRVWLGFCELARFDSVRARAICESAAAFVTEDTDPWNVGELRLLEALASLTSDAGAAERAFDEALGIFSSSADPIDFDKARALDQWGRATRDHRLVEQAAAIYRQLPNALLLRTAEEWLAQERKHPGFTPAEVAISDDDLLKALARAGMRPEGGAPIRVIGEKTRQKLKEAFRIGKNSFDTPKLIEGETGTGKEVIARLLHAGSPRAAKPFVSVSCSEITESLFESEMFGHKKGAFTDAKEDKVGLIEQANGGTLFLDEIHSLSFNNARKLLKVVQERVVRRVGSSTKVEVDLNLVCATNVNLHKRAKKGKFPPDLLERIGVITIKTVPLRERPKEIRVLADHFVASYAARHGWTECRLDEEAHELLATHSWPGNIRMLRRLLERAVIDTENAPIGVSSLLHASTYTPGVAFDYANPVPTRESARTASQRFERIVSEFRDFLLSPSGSLHAPPRELCEALLDELVLHARATSPSHAEAGRRLQVPSTTFKGMHMAALERTKPE